MPMYEVVVTETITKWYRVEAVDQNEASMDYYEGVITDEETEDVTVQDVKLAHHQPDDPTTNPARPFTSTGITPSIQEDESDCV